MRNNWVFLDLDGGSPYIPPIEPFMAQNIGSHLFPHICSFMDNSRHQFRHLFVPGSLALQEALNSISKFSGALLFWFSSAPSSNMTHEIVGNPHGSKSGSCKYITHVKNSSPSRRIFTGFQVDFGSRVESASSVLLDKILTFTMKLLDKEAGGLQSRLVLSLAAALIPPFNTLSSDILAVPLENTDVQVHSSIDRRPCEVERRGCSGISFPDMNWTRHAVEPKTRIEFPMILDDILAGEKIFSSSSEVLVGTGSRTMKIVKIKSLNVYAFGFYVHPHSVCEKLGPKYACTSADKLNKCIDFYQDLLREDIGMTIRLVVNCNGMKITTVKDAFEKSLRARLLKTNPGTDYHCLRTFGSYFTQDIPLPAGTTIDFRRTADGQLITEIGGNVIGAVHSKDLCRAFFDMYIGDVPVSQQTKEEIGKNVASLIRKCRF